MKRITVVPRSRIGRGVESPLPQSDRINDERVFFPVRHGITLERQTDVLGMRTSVGRDDAEEVHVLIQENDDTGNCRICVAYGASTSRGCPSGRHFAVGSSCRTSPVGFCMNSASPPGLKGAKFVGSKFDTLGVSVSPGPPRWVKPSPAHTPVKSGCPSAVRGIDARR